MASRRFSAIMATTALLAACGTEPGGGGSPDARTAVGATSIASEVAGVGAASSDNDAPASGARPAQEARCTIEHLGSHPLVLGGGREAYVEPHALVVNEDGVLLAGAPSYLWRRVVAPRSRVWEGRDLYVAARLEGAGATVIEPPPGLGVPDHVRAAALPDGRFGAVMSFAPTGSVDSFDREVEAIWYGEHDGRAWTALERLDSVPGAVAVPLLSTGLVAAGDRLLWILPWDSPGIGNTVVQYERRDGVWDSHVLEDFARVEAFDLAYGEEHGLWLAAAGPDPTAAEYVHSLRLYRHRGTWELVHGIAELGPGEHAREPRLVVGPSGVSVAWLHETARGGAAMAVHGIDSATAPAPVVLHPDVTQAVPLLLGDGTPVWVLSRPLPSVLSSELRVLVGASGGVTTALILPNPYTGYFAAAAFGSRITIAGPQFDPRPAEPIVRSLFIDLGASCL